MGHASPNTSPAVSDRLPQLDGLRGVAVLFVVWHHFGLPIPKWVDWGPIAPSIFMVLSGYLITRSLLKMRGNVTCSGLLSFHGRRITRLLPALYTMLALGWLTGLEEFRDNIFWHAGFLTNVHMAVTGEWAGFLSHLWSLALQEQFYLVWPLILLLPARYLLPTLLVAYAGAAVFRAWCLDVGASDLLRWFMLPGSLDAFAAGGLVAWAQTARGGAEIIPRNLRFPVAAISIACWVVSRHLRHLEGTGNPALALVETFETVLFGWVLIELLQHRKGIVSKAFSLAPLVAIGRISYGVYIWHMMVLHALRPYLAAAGLDQNVFLRCAILTVACVGVAALSWIALEKPFVAWGRHLTAPEALLLSLRDRLARLCRPSIKLR